MLGFGLDVPRRNCNRSGNIRAGAIVVSGVFLTDVLLGGCMAVTPQLPPTDFDRLERLEDREARDEAYAENSIYVHEEPQGLRYTKGDDPAANKRSWQSLDVILRSDRNASEALPYRELKLSRLFTALTLASTVVAIAGVAASAREGLDFQEMTGPGAVLLGGGIASIGFGITAGVFYGKAREGYQGAVEIYNESLGMRLGVVTPDGKYIPPRGVLVDDEGYIILDEKEKQYVEPDPEPAPQRPSSGQARSGQPASQEPESDDAGDDAEVTAPAQEDGDRDAEPSRADEDAPTPEISGVRLRRLRQG